MWGNNSSGGGGVTFSLKQQLAAKNRTYPHYIVGRCSIHAIQLMLGNPMKSIFGDGGLLKRNALQLLHSAYNLQNEFESVELKKMWKETVGLEIEK